MRKIAVVLALLALAGIATPVYAGCWGWIPYGSFLGGQRLGLGPGYPGLFPPVFSWPLAGYGWEPERIVVPPSVPTIEVNVYPEIRVVAPEKPANPDNAQPQVVTKDEDEFVKARRLYPRGLPGVEYVWSPGRAVIHLRNGNAPAEPK
jgi:hypothetical protein